MSDEELSLETRLMDLIDKEDNLANISDDETTTNEESNEDSLEADSENKEQEQEEQRTIKIKHNGQEIEKPESEIIDLAEKGFDYTQKAQNLADERRSVEAAAKNINIQSELIQQQAQVQSALINEIAKVTAIDQQLANYANVDWQALSNADPVEAQKLFFAYNRLQTERNGAVEAVTKKQQEITQNMQELTASRIAEGQAILKRDIPGWNDEVAKSLIQTARDYGFDDKEIATIIDPRQVKIMHDAMQWRKLQADKKVTEKKVSTAPPMVKPGAKDTKNAATSQVKADREALRKTGKGDYAARLIERML